MLTMGPEENEEEASKNSTVNFPPALSTSLLPRLCEVFIACSNTHSNGNATAELHMYDDTVRRHPLSQWAC